MIVNVPLVAPGQDVGVDVKDPVSPGPAVTVIVAVPVQPRLSLTPTV